MSPLPATLALVFDFDDTLVPDSTTKLIQSKGIDPQQFWTKDVKSLVDEGFDPALAYLTLLLDNIGPDKPLGALTDADLRSFGATLDEDFYQGLPELFDELRTLVNAQSNHINIEYYIISGGLQAVIEGSETVKKYFSGVYGCQLAGDGKGMLRAVKRCVTFTEKTRYLFEINKGIPPLESATQPHLVNTDVPSNQRRIPWQNVFYVGDGLTDIPCFSLVKSNGGTPFGVFDPAQKSKAKQAFQEFLKTDRVTSMHAPRYLQDDDLGAILRAAIATRCGLIELEAEQAYRF